MAGLSQTPLLLLLLLLLLGCSPCSCQETSSEASALEKSVQPFYDAIEAFLDFLQPLQKSVLLQDVSFIITNSSSSPILNTPWQQSAQRYADNMLGYLILICIGVFLIIFVPLIGCAVCCCRCCCNRCTGQRHKMERRNSGLKRIVYGVLLAFLLVVMLFGTVLAFISNDVLHDRMDYKREDSVVNEVASALADSGSLLQEIPRQAKAKSGSVLEGVVRRIPTTVEAAANETRDQLLKLSGAQDAMAAAFATAEHLSSSTAHAGDYVDRFDAYNTSVLAVQAMLEFVQANVSESLNSSCPLNVGDTVCRSIRTKLPTLRVTQLPSRAGYAAVALLHSGLLAANHTALQTQLLTIQEVLSNISQVVVQLAANRTSDVQQKLNGSVELDTLWSTLDSLFSSMAEPINDAAAFANRTVRNPVSGETETPAQLATFFEQYRYFLCIGVGSAALFIICCHLLGLAFGFCGERPQEDAACCNKGVGANCLLAGSAIALLLFAAAFLLLLLLFLLGALADTEACRLMSGRKGSAGYAKLDDTLNSALRSLAPGVAQYSLKVFSGLLGSCSSGNASITEALQIGQLIRTDSLNAIVGEFANTTRQQLVGQSGKLTGSVDMRLNLSLVEAAAMEAAAVDLTPFMAELSNDLISGSPEVFDAIRSIANSASEPDVKQQFTNISDYILRSTELAERLAVNQRQLLLKLQTSLRQFNASAAGLTVKLSTAHQILQRPLSIEEAVGAGIAKLSADMINIVRSAIAQILDAAADCRTVNQLLLRAIRAPCVAFLQPFNGFWAGMGVCLLCLVLAMLISVKLANLYRKPVKYEYRPDSKTLPRIV